MFIAKYIFFAMLAHVQLSSFVQYCFAESPYQSLVYRLYKFVSVWIAVLHPVCYFVAVFLTTLNF